MLRRIPRKKKFPPKFKLNKLSFRAPAFGREESAVCQLKRKQIPHFVRNDNLEQIPHFARNDNLIWLSRHSARRSKIDGFRRSLSREQEHGTLGRRLVIHWRRSAEGCQQIDHQPVILIRSLRNRVRRRADVSDRARIANAYIHVAAVCGSRGEHAEARCDGRVNRSWSARPDFRHGVLSGGKWREARPRIPWRAQVGKQRQLGAKQRRGWRSDRQTTCVEHCDHRDDTSAGSSVRIGTRRLPLVARHIEPRSIREGSYRHRYHGPASSRGRSARRHQRNNHRSWRITGWRRQRRR
jgi:hypothetical protein